MPSLMETIKTMYRPEEVKEETKTEIVEQDDKVEKEEMALSQLYFVKYASEEIIEYIEEMDGEVEEWYQNKLSKVHSDMESLHSHIEGEKRRLGLDDDDEEEEDEDEDEMKESTNIQEASYRVDVEGLPIMYVQSASPNEVMMNLRKILKKGDFVNSIDRVTDAEVKKAFRLKAIGKDEDEMNEESQIDEKISVVPAGTPNTGIYKVGGVTTGTMARKPKPTTPSPTSNLRSSTASRLNQIRSRTSSSLSSLRKEDKEEVERIEEMDKSQPSSSRGAEGVPVGTKADPVKTDKVKQDALKVLQKQYKKEEVELEEAAHKVSVTVSDPNHPMVSKRDEKMEKRVIVNADNKDHAVVKAKEFYKKKGLNVHDANYHSPQGKSTMKTEEVKVGDKVHVGLTQKGGSGMKGTVHKIDGDTVHVNVGTGKFGDRIVKGSMKNVTKEETTPPFTPDKKKPPIATPGKAGYGPSAAKHLAKTGMKKQQEKPSMKTEDVEIEDEMINEDLMKLDPITNTLVGLAVAAGVAMYAFDFWFGKDDYEKTRKPIERGMEKAEKAGNAKLYHSLAAKYYEDRVTKYTKALDKLRNDPNTFYKKDSLKTGAKKGEMKKFEKRAEEELLRVLEIAKKKQKEFEAKEKSGEAISKKYYESVQQKQETLSIEETIKRVVMGEKLHPNQKKLDVDGDGDIEADDFADLRAGKHKKKEEKKSGGKEQIDVKPKLDEEEMSDADMKKREEIVKSLKKRTQDFKDRYGDRWKEVMYATATKMAMKD